MYETLNVRYHVLIKRFMQNYGDPAEGGDS